METIGAVINNFGNPKKFGSRDFEKRHYGGRRTNAPVRRHSFMKGREGVFWRSTNRQTVRKIVFAAKRYELETKEKGKRNGALGHVALEVLDYFANLVDYRTGRLDPSLDTLMLKLHRSRDAIVRALKALRTHGFIDWLRRFVPTGNEGRGPKYHQTSNAYRLSMPKRALEALGRYGKKAPIPDDFAHDQEQQAADLENMISSLTKSEKALHIIEDPLIAAAVARLGGYMDERKLRDQRESAKQSESISKSINIGKNIKGHASGMT